MTGRSVASATARQCASDARLGRLVVVGRHEQQPGGPGVAARRGHLDAVRGVVGADPGDDGGAVADRLDDGLHQLDALVVGGVADSPVVPLTTMPSWPCVDEVGGQPLGAVEVEAAVGSHRGDHGRQDPAERGRWCSYPQAIAPRARCPAPAHGAVADFGGKAPSVAPTRTAHGGYAARPATRRTLRLWAGHGGSPPGYAACVQQYLDLLDHVMTTGTDKSDRTGTGTRSVFGYQMRFDLSEGFPVLTTKKLHLKSIIGELLWFLRGDSNVRWLQERGITIWDEWADENGDLGPVYGYQWRSWPTPGRPATSTRSPRSSSRSAPTPTAAATSSRPGTSPTSTRWRCRRATRCSSSTCAADGTGKLSCQLYQRSADIFLGVPFNIASYALLTMMVAQVCDLEPGDFVHTLGDAHLYSNHVEQATLQLTREPLPLPQMKIASGKDIDQFDLGDFELVGYEAAPVDQGADRGLSARPRATPPVASLSP